MKIFGKYFRYHFKSTFLRVPVIALLSVLIITACLSSELKPWVDEYAYMSNCAIYILATLLGALCAIIPIFEFAGLNSRRNLDTLLFLPIDRKKLAAVHYLSGLAQVGIIYTVSFVYHLIWLLPYREIFALEYMLPYYLLSLLVGVLMYSIFTFIFIQANNTVDGIIFEILYIFVACIVFYGSAALIKSNYLAEQSPFFILYAPINNITVVYQDAINVTPLALGTASERYLHILDFKLLGKSIQSLVFWAVMGVASIPTSIYTFARKKPEKAGGISDSWFGYKVLIPIYGISAFNIFADTIDAVIGSILTFICMLVGYIIYRRSVRLRRSDLIILGACIAMLVFGMIF